MRSGRDRRAPRVLITGCGGVAAKNFARALREAPEPISVVGADANRWHLRNATDLDRRVLVPPWQEDDDACVEVLNALVDRFDIDAVVPQPDADVARVGRLRARLRARTWLPPQRTIEVFQDKLATARALAAAGVPAPATEPAAPDEAAAFSRVRERSTTVWVRARAGAGSRAALPCDTIDQARGWMRWWRERRGLGPEGFLFCEYLPGAEYAFQSVWRDGEIVCAATRERLEYVFGSQMPSGQSSSPSVALSVHAGDVERAAAAAVRAVDPDATGIFCVDLKRRADGTPCVTEVNCGRLFTTSLFFTRLGANMPYLYLCLALGREPEAASGVRLGPRAVPPGFLWIRDIDREPMLVRDGELAFDGLAGGRQHGRLARAA